MKAAHEKGVCMCVFRAPGQPTGSEPTRAVPSAPCGAGFEGVRGDSGTSWPSAELWPRLIFDLRGRSYTAPPPSPPKPSQLSADPAFPFSPETVENHREQIFH